MASFTPGPWQIDGEAAECEARITADSEPIADVFCLDRPDDDDAEEAKANVALIAAAPELLAALEAFMHAEATDDPDDYIRAVHLATPALAKAKGE